MLVQRLRNRLRRTTAASVRRFWREAGEGLRYRLRGSPGTSAPPIFVVGAGHSGTSLLLALLDSHSRIHAVPYESDLARSPHPHRLLRRFEAGAIVHGKARWAEKTPLHIRHLDRLFALVPDSRIVLILRDGRDVAASMEARTGDLAGGIEAWVEDNAIGERHWEDPRVCVVRYEDLVTSLRETLEPVLGFLGEVWEPSLARHHGRRRRWYTARITATTPADHARHRNWQINQPLFDGRGRWRRLDRESRAIVRERAQASLERYGYVEDGSWAD